MLPLVGSEMMSDAISHKCRTSGQEWGEEITDGFQNLGRQACDGQCGARRSSDWNAQATSNSLGLHSGPHLGPEWSTVLQFQITQHLFLLHLVTEGHMAQKGWGPTLGLFTYQSAWSSHQPSRLRLLHLPNRCRLSSHPIWPW